MQRLPAGLGLTWICVFLSGATGLVYQAVWLRCAAWCFLFVRLAPRLKDLVTACGGLESGMRSRAASQVAQLTLSSSG